MLTALKYLKMRIKKLKIKTQNNALLKIKFLEVK
jgi:hypothetical protein